MVFELYYFLERNLKILEIPKIDPSHCFSGVEHKNDKNQKFPFSGTCFLKCQIIWATYFPSEKDDMLISYESSMIREVGNLPN